MPPCVCPLSAAFFSFSTMLGIRHTCHSPVCIHSSRGVRQLIAQAKQQRRAVEVHALDAQRGKILNSLPLLRGIIGVVLRIPLPVRHRHKMPAQVLQLSALEQRSASWLAPHKVRWSVYLDRDGLLATAINQQVQAIAFINHHISSHRQSQQCERFRHLSLRAGRLNRRGPKRGGTACQKCCPRQSVGAPLFAGVPQAPLVELAQVLTFELVSKRLAAACKVLVEEQRLHRQAIRSPPG